LDRAALDAYVARRLPDARVFVGLSGCGLATGREARRRGIKYVCDRGSTHIRHQHDVLRDEHDRWGLDFPGIDPRIVEREEAEYETADLVTVPSSYVQGTFTARGVPAHRTRVLSYGVDLQRFQPVDMPPAGRFDLLFVGGVSLRKGVPYLRRAGQKGDLHVIVDVEVPHHLSRAQREALEAYAQASDEIVSEGGLLERMRGKK